MALADAIDPRKGDAESLYEGLPQVLTFLRSLALVALDDEHVLYEFAPTAPMRVRTNLEEIFVLTNTTVFYVHSAIARRAAHETEWHLKVIRRRRERAAGTVEKIEAVYECIGDAADFCSRAVDPQDNDEYVKIWAGEYPFVSGGAR